MEEVIKQIIDIEDKAQGIIDEANKEKEQKELEHKKKLEALEATIISDAKEKVKQIRAREFDEIREQEEEKVRRCDRQIVEMEKYAEDNMEKWVNDLVNRVLK